MTTKRVRVDAGSLISMLLTCAFDASKEFDAPSSVAGLLRELDTDDAVVVIIEVPGEQPAEGGQTSVSMGCPGGF